MAEIMMRDAIRRTWNQDENAYTPAINGEVVFYADYADLKSQLAEEKSDNRANLDAWSEQVKKLGERKDELEHQLAEAKKLAEWMPITEQQKPVGQDHLLYVDSDGIDLYAIGYFNRLAQRWFVNGAVGEYNTKYTHFRPIAPPQPKGKDTP